MAGLMSIQRQLLRILHLLFFASVLGAVFAPTAWSEVWTDKTGKFSIEAKYIGVSGTNVLLEKSDGTTISVPIAKLSDESVAQAKKFYEMAKAAPKPDKSVAEKSGDGKEENGNEASPSSGYKPLARELNFVPPVPPKLAPLAPFPTNVSLQTAWEHVRDQALAGHLEVFWHALPSDMRDFADGAEVREKLRPFVQESNISISPETIRMISRLTEVLVTKKDFVLNSQLLSAVPPEQLPLLKQGYDPAVGLIHEYADFSFSLELIYEYPISDLVNYHLPRIGAHLQQLVKLIPEELRNFYLGQITTEQTSATTGTMTIPGDGGEMQTIEMVLYNDRWLPKEMVDGWLAEKDTIIDKMVANASSGMEIGNNPDTNLMIAAMVRQIDALLDPMLAAEDQQAFDSAVGQAMLPFLGLGDGPQLFGEGIPDQR